MGGTTITHQRNGRMESYMVSTKITLQRMENQMVGPKITCPRVGQYKITRLRDGWHKNNLPKGWTDGELNGQHENSSPKDGESNSEHENNLPKGWTAQK